MEYLLPFETDLAAGDTLVLAARRPPDPAMTIGLLDNGKPHAHELLTEIGEVLVARGIGASYFMVRKPNAGQPLTAGERAEMLARADLIVSGVGACGACTSCSVHDAIRFECAGVPATTVVTEVFTTIADSTADSLGLPGYHYAVVPHPIWTRSPEWMRETAEDIADLIIDQLTSS